MDNPNGKKNMGGDSGRNQNLMRILLIGLLCLMAITFLTRIVGDGSEKISYNEFLTKVQNADASDIKNIELDRAYNKITLTIKESGREVTYETGMVGDLDDLSSMLLSRGIKIEGRIIEENSTWVELLIYMIVPSLMIFAVFNFMMRKGGGGGIMGVGKSTAKMYMQKETGVTFADVAGQDEAQESLMEIVDFLHNPGRYTAIGAKLPKGALLVGPPGTGKTLLAKAVAGEAKVPFFSLAGSDFVEMFVGVGASRVRDLFKQAQQQAPCIVFIDEIDAIGKSRDSRLGGNDEREQTLNQLLAEMDGFDSSKGVFILAATNRPEVLDPALLRPGRLDRRIIVDKPDLKGRLAILKVHSKDVHMDDTVDLDAIALATSGAVGSDLANMINEAAILAVKNRRQAVSQTDLFESVEVVVAGKEKKDRIMNDSEKRMVSYHEVGHALAAALQKHTEPVQKITIVPRTMGSLGYVMQTPEEEKFLMTKAELESELVTLLAGRASEEIFFESVSTGASNDIEKATKIARSMVTRFGMSDEFGLMGLETIQGQYLDGRAVLNCGEQTAAKVDIVVMGMLKEAYEKAKALISSNKMAMNRIAAFLIEKETITGKEFMKILQEVQDEEKQLEAEAERKMQEAREQEAEEQDASGSAAKEPKDAGLGEVWTDSGETSVFEQPKVDLKKELKAEAEKEKEETAQEDSVQE
ncbi:ATP-dependent zinc metalloprotease FtsH [Hominifimenecus microfluidus]|uniref:ATP-dependent zinc metalloprotease FtsH n=1 Tax=Hominifimenecus microfluidus TaxID=2885348 RepID=A0AAE3E9E8_9FIRM|nr:ATP-dependent zinc metalloprotease FtsH [Hominifimenecus microfluidus]MCC2229835.1 ATP-dependent zinc metalloprotease FtsH [Hominifimenecus microfluidus]